MGECDACVNAGECAELFVSMSGDQNFGKRRKGFAKDCQRDWWGQIYLTNWVLKRGLIAWSQRVGFFWKNSIQAWAKSDWQTYFLTSRFISQGNCFVTSGLILLKNSVFEDQELFSKSCQKSSRGRALLLSMADTGALLLELRLQGCLLIVHLA